MRIRPLYQFVLLIFVYQILQCLPLNTAYDVVAQVAPAFWLLMLVVIAYYLLQRFQFDGYLSRKWSQRLSGQESESLSSSVAAPVTGLLVLAIAIFSLEYRDPCFFTQDDNLVQFLPVMVEGMRGALSGHAPTWNPYQLLGAPTMTVGVYALTYPITYLSYFFSRFVLGHEYWTVEVYSIFHFVTGFLAFFWAARRYGVRPWIASAAALSCDLSGYALMASRSWYYVSSVFLFVPLIVVAVSYLQNGRTGWKWIAATGLMFGLFFHAGNVQFWTYGLIFFWLAVFLLWTAGRIGVGAVLRACSATLLGIVVALPLLVPFYVQTRGILRPMPIYIGGITGQWLSFLIPGPWIGQYDPIDWIDPAWKTGALMVYSGTVFLGFAVLSLARLVIFRGWREAMSKHLWTICACVALAAALGMQQLLWRIMMRVPLLDGFRLPFKFVGFFNVFALLTGAIVCEYLLRRLRNGKVLGMCIATLAFGTVAVVCSFHLESWYSYGFKPYPGAPEIRRVLPQVVAGEYRAMSLGFERGRSASYSASLPHNLPTLLHIPMLLGYDPLVEQSPAFHRIETNLETRTLDLLSEYGVRYALSPKDVRNPSPGPYPHAWVLEVNRLVPRHGLEPILQNSRVIYENDAIVVRELNNAKPLAFVSSDVSRPLGLRFYSDGLDVDTRSVPVGGQVIVNFFWYSQMQAKADGIVVPIGRDSFGRMVVDITKSTDKLELRFRPKWSLGFLAALLVGIGSIASAKLANRLEAVPA